MKHLSKTARHLALALPCCLLLPVGTFAAGSTPATPLARSNAASIANAVGNSAANSAANSVTSPIKNSVPSSVGNFVAKIPGDEPVRVKDLGKLQGWRENALFGTGIVTGLAGTGDSPYNRSTRQALSNVMARFNLAIAPEQIQSRNVAVVMVSAVLPTFARAGDTLDITVTSSGDARSLVGGSLLLTALSGADGKVRALAQGALSVGGYRYDANGNVVQKNHPTVGAVPNGAIVEEAMTAQLLRPDQSITFVLAEPDYTTASRVAQAINSQIAPGIAQARDANGIDVTVPPAQRDRLVDFLALLENVRVAPDRRARVVINERTGTVVAGGDVRIASVSISHGDLKISVTVENSAALPDVFREPDGGLHGLAGDAAYVYGSPLVPWPNTLSNTRIDIEEARGTGHVAASNTVADLVQSLARLNSSTRDMISILRAVKAAGALHAELVVQ